MKETQYKVTKCCQSTTKDEEGKVNKHCWNTAYFFLSLISHIIKWYLEIIGDLSAFYRSQYPKIILMASYDVMFSTFSCNLKATISFLYWIHLEFKIREEHCVLKYPSFNPNHGTKVISMILNEVQCPQFELTLCWFQKMLTTPFAKISKNSSSPFVPLLLMKTNRVAQTCQEAQ